MLILTRRPGESIEIGGNIKVTVLEIQNKQVRVRIETPPEFLVLRVADKRFAKEEQGGRR